MKKKTIKDIPVLKGKTVFLTADFNISLKDGKVANDTRIIESLPTIKYLRDHGAKIIIASHLGRPKGIDNKLSLAPVARRLSSISKYKVHLINHFWDANISDKIEKIDPSDLILLENIRFYDGEEKNDSDFSRHLASLANYFINDAFGTSHRIHASIVGIAEYLPSYAGLLMEREIEMISQALEKPKRPLLCIIGGAKTPEKIAVIEKILDIADTVALGGAIANTFLAAWGFGMGRSLIDYEMIEMARVVFWKATRKHSALILPLDVVISDLEKNKTISAVDYNKVPHNVAIYDIGPKTIANMKSLIASSQTIIWNGPMGLYEDHRFAKGTDAILKNIAQFNKFSIVGGGDTLTSLKSKALSEKISHISTGGSAMLEFMEKGTLPGIEVLQDKS